MRFCPVFNLVEVAAFFLDAEFRCIAIHIFVPVHRHHTHVPMTHKGLAKIVEAMLWLRISG
jgi:hypothetical protein